MSPLDVLETCLYVDDLPRAEQFYCEVLQLKLLSRQAGRHAFFHCGRAMLLLFDARATAIESGVPPHGAKGPGHVAFRVPEPELQAWERHLSACRVAVEKTVTWPQGGRSLYFRDPSGNSLELASPRIWQIEQIDEGDLPSCLHCPDRATP